MYKDYYKDLGNNGPAIDCLEKALDTGNESEYLRQLLMDLYLKDGQAEKANKLFKAYEKLMKRKNKVLDPETLRLGQEAREASKE